MEQIFCSVIDQKNIALAKTLFSLRHDLDIHCLIGVNASKINENGTAKSFFGHLAMRSIESIVLAICKVYENERRQKLNSIQGVLNSLRDREPKLQVNDKELHDFIGGYNGPFDIADSVAALQETFTL